MRWLLLLIFIVTLATSPPATHAAEPGAELTISILTIGPGDLVFEKFGHNAIRVKDAWATPPDDDLVFHWGIFDFDQKDFFFNYAAGRMDYAMGGFEFQRELRYYRGLNREVVEQELNLTPAQRLKLRNFLRWNEQPENATYRYNYYTDNCSTRARDALDEVIDGRIKSTLEPKPTDTTFRWHTRRLTRDNLFWYAVLHTALGPATDRKINAWEECFLPLRLRDQLGNITTVDASGATVPLVKSQQVLAASTRPPEPQAQPNWVVHFFIAGLAIVAALVGLQRWAERKPRSRSGKVAFCLAATLYAALLGICGFIGLWFWLFSHHWAAWRNENLFGYSPLALPLALFMPVLFRKSPWVKKIAACLAIAVATTTVIGVLLSPILPQANAEPMAFVLPINLALAWCVWRGWRTSVRPPAAAALDPAAQV